MLDYSVLVRSK